MPRAFLGLAPKIRLHQIPAGIFHGESKDMLSDNFGPILLQLNKKKSHDVRILEENCLACPLRKKCE